MLEFNMLIITRNQKCPSSSFYPQQCCIKSSILLYESLYIMSELTLAARLMMVSNLFTCQHPARNRRIIDNDGPYSTYPSKASNLGASSPGLSPFMHRFELPFFTHLVGSIVTKLNRPGPSVGNVYKFVSSRSALDLCPLIVGPLTTSAVSCCLENCTLLCASGA